MKVSSHSSRQTGVWEGGARSHRARIASLAVVHAVSFATVAVLMTAATSPARAAEAPFTGFVIDSEAGDTFGDGLLFDEDPGTLTGTIVVDNSTTVTLEGGGWKFRFSSDGDAFSVRTYVNDGGPSDLDLWRDGDPCSGGDWAYRVLEVPVLGVDGSLVTFAADFWKGCGNAPQRLHGSIRYGSALPTQLARVTGSLTFPDTLVGSSSPSQLITVRNAGSGDITLQPGQVGGAHPADFPSDDACGSVSLDPGQYCEIAVRFVPIRTTQRNAVFEITTDTFETTRSVSLSGYGLSPLTTLPTILVIHSRNGNVPAAGDYRYDPATFAARLSGGGIALTNADWALTFIPPSGQTLQAGSYEDVGPVASPDKGAIGVTAFGNVCPGGWIFGSFEVLDDPVIDSDGTVVQLAVDFDYSCTGIPDEVRGWVRFHSDRAVPPVPVPGYTIDVQPIAAQAGDTITITPQPAGTDLFLIKRCTMILEGSEGQPDWVRMMVASDDCAPWTFTLPASVPGTYVIRGALFYGDSTVSAQHTIFASPRTLTVEGGGSATAFASNYPVQSWAAVDLLADLTPTFGEPQTLKVRSGLDGCVLAFFAGMEGAWTRQDAGCQPWTFAVPAPEPNVALPMFGTRADVRLIGWTGTSSWDDDRPDLSFRGSRWGETYRVDVPEFVGSGGSYASDLPAIFAGAARGNVYYVDDPDPHSFAPVVVGATSGSCWLADRATEMPISGGSCGTYEVPVWDSPTNGTRRVTLELRDVGGHTIAGTSTDIGFVRRMSSILIETQGAPEAGTGFTITATTETGTPASYGLSIDPLQPGAATLEFDGVFAPSIDSDGDVVAIPGSGLSVGTYDVAATFTDVKGATSSAFGVVDVIDTQSPTGSVVIGGGAAYTRVTAVTLELAAQDPSEVPQVSLSNDGLAWTSRSFAPTQPWTLQAKDGTRTVFAKFMDSAGHWSSPTKDTIVLDSVAPASTSPKSKLADGTGLTSGRIPVRLVWSGSDTTAGIARYEIDRSRNGGRWTGISSALASSSTTQALDTGQTYRFRVRAVDRAGNVGAWAYGREFLMAGYQQTASRFSWSGGWTTSAGPSWWGGSARSTSKAGAKASLTATGRSYAWIGTTAPNRGKARVYVNGVLVSTVDLHSATTRNQQILWSANWKTSAKRTITIIVRGTAGRPRADVDGFAILR